MSLQEAYAVVARHYDTDYQALGYDEDIDFYVNAARRSGGPVLEMGCGSGRVLLPVAEAGVAVHGMELSGDMLERLETEAGQLEEATRPLATWQQGDMRRDRAQGRYPLVTAPFRVIQHLLTRQDQRAWLQNVARHLTPGGRLIFDVFQPDYSIISDDSGEPFKELDYTDNGSGKRITRHAQVRHQPEIQLFDLKLVWREYDSQGQQTGTEETSFRMRWFVKGELENLLELEGFRVAEFWGDFKPTPFGPGATQQIVEAVMD
ncbi:MAG TPA: class I SAM-dependent methyltransferase [Acidobacteriota bacterium]|nr:class I SAM-dependent methyltransferase [Acidobacteriota bacterium]